MTYAEVLKLVKGNIIPIAKKISVKEQHAPMFFVGKGYKIFPILVPMHDDIDKDFTAHFMESACRKIGADFAIFITECWFVNRDIVAEGIQPSKCSDRQEALQVLILFREGKNVSYMIPINRVDGKVEFGKLRKGSQSLGGRFVFTW